MKVRRYRAVNLQEAFAQAQAELGEDAVLLHQQEVQQPSSSGRRPQTLVEITVGVDETAQAETPVRSLFTRQLPAEAAPPAARPFASSRPAESRQRLRSAGEESEFESLRREMAQIRSLLQRRQRGADDLPAGLLEWSEALSETAIPGHWVERLLDGLDEMLTPAALQRNDMVGAALSRRMVAEMAPAAGPLRPGKPGSPLVYVLVGPTGVGKTTTIAKLAAHYSLQKRQPIALITADTYRIGAVSQLRTYSELINTPLDVAYTPAELAGLVEKHNDKSLILIDTPGRSPADREQLSLLESFLHALDEPHLEIALAAGTPLLDARRIVERFSILPPSGVVLTKIDETCQLGSVCTLLAEQQLPLTYFTTGQRVPEDIEVASNEALLERLLAVAQERLAEGEKPNRTAIFADASRFQPFVDFARAH